MTIEYDKIADAVYWKLKKTKIKKTQNVSDTVIFDYDTKGEIVGIEILNIASQPTILKDIEKSIKEGVPVSLTSLSTCLATV